MWWTNNKWGDKMLDGNTKWRMIKKAEYREVTVDIWSALLSMTLSSNFWPYQILMMVYCNKIN
jgi:hypothetical protein